MDNEKFQELVLQQLRSLNEGQKNYTEKSNTLEQGQNLLAKHVTELVSNVNKLSESQVRMENELTEKVRALFDAREVQNNINERIITSLDRIEAKVEVLQLETASIRRVK